MHRQTARPHTGVTRRCLELATGSLLVATIGLVGIAGSSAAAGSATAASPTSRCRGSAAMVTCTFFYNGTDGTDGAVQTFVVPTGVTEATIEAWGAQGGDVGGAVGGPGGYSDGTVAVAPGDVLDVLVGGKPTGQSGGFNGGGAAGPQESGYGAAAGGGATDVRLGGDALSDRIVVAGGGGGSAFNSAMTENEYNNWTIALGGDGGAAGAPSVTCSESPWQACGQGGSATTGGAAGTTTSAPCATAGTAGSGGTGCGGGGGGGYYGGGGGGFVDGDADEGIPLDGPGGGGSGYVTPTATAVRTGAGLQFGNGQVRISYVSTRRHGGITWAPPVPIDSTGAALSGISCPTTTFCVAVDTAGNAATENAGRWSPFSPVAGPGNSFTSVSCASESFCIAVGTAPPDPDDDQDLAVIDANGVWSSNTSARVDPGVTLADVSCARDTEFCMAVGWGPGGPGLSAVSETYNGHSWTWSNDGSGYGSAGDKFTSVSCVSARFCVVGGILQQRSDIGDYLGIGYHNKSGGGQITNEQVDGLSGEIDSVACAGDSCFAAGDGDLVFAVKRATWTGPTSPDGPSTITALSCSTSARCIAVDNEGSVLTAVAGVWSAPLSIDPGQIPTAVSCAAVNFCVAVDAAGNAIVGS